MRKNIFLYLAICFASIAFVSCDKDEPSGNSIFDTSAVQKNEFDKWLLKNYVDQYNIDFKYRMEDIESDFAYNLVPADVKLTIKMAKIMQFIWLQAYDEVAGIDFTRANVPRVLHIIGSAAWDQGTFTLGVAEGGIKVTLYLGNWLDPTNITELNNYYFHTMHHEFTHILHQKKSYPTEYNTLSQGNYAPTTWFNRTDVKEYAPLGFITNYAGSEPVEDIAEITSNYLTMPKAEWDAVIAAAGDAGAKIINEKVKIMKKYMKDTWKIDMDQLRQVIDRRSEQLKDLDLDSLN